MKNLLTLIFLVVSLNAFAVCLNPLSRTNMTKPESAKYNNDFNNLQARYNELPGDCVANDSLRDSELEDSSVTTDKIANNTITADKFAPGVFPIYGKPLRIRAYTTSGTWQKSIDTGSVFVQVIGGGSAASAFSSGNCTSTSGQASSFGSLCVANGGSTSSGAGGSSAAGDLNINGGNGSIGYFQCTNHNGSYCEDSTETGGAGGRSVVPSYGFGGSSFDGGYQDSFTTGYFYGGGAGGYCARSILASSLPDSVPVTVGARGAFNCSSVFLARDGGQGLVLVYEYAK